MNSVSPIKLKYNRVWRIYLGGACLDEFRGETGKDGYFPEDWIASVVIANNPDRDDAPVNEGLSESTEGGYLRDIIESDPELYLGKNHTAKYGKNFGVLTKFLDSAERLPIQVHPDKQAAKTLFNSDYGKTEAWYILGGREINREKPHILLGFKEDVTKEKLHELFDKQDIPAMAELMHKVYVKPGDIFIIKGGTPHAIGPGCFLLEVQEPTDYTISLEKCNTLGEKLPDFLCHMGIGFDKMFDCFHYVKHSYEELINEFKLNSYIIKDDDNYRITKLIDYSDTPCFGLNRIDVSSSVEIDKDEYACAYVVISGSGSINGLQVRKGDDLFIPAGCNKIEFEITEPLSILECLPPQ